MSWYLKVLKNYAGFGGRARRKEFWMFTLVNVIIAFVLGMVDAVLGTFDPETGIGLLGAVYALAVLLPSIAVTTRRLHDTNRSGWWQLLYFIPLIGVLVVLIFTLLEGTPGDNHFGADPKADEWI
ncbi:DUF805 domain-containing protein [Neisseria sp. CCUG12390]|uniref:DUF805 domain-containing protein n=1 Tax=Neisseria sp. CCUG12390 TaxID=3392035 RepID=UPI003A0FED23